MLQNLQNNFAIDTPQDLGQSFSEKFLNVFPNIPMMIATILAFALAFGFLVFFFYKPIKKKMKERHDYIQKNIDASLSEKELAIQKTNEANAKLEEAHKQADVIVNKAKMRAEKVIITYTAKAKRDAKYLLDEANRDIAAQKVEFERQSKNKIAEAAVEIAKKIITKNEKLLDHQEVIDDFINSDVEQIKK
ncbi:ATP synthase F0 subunit B [Mycoplasmopsis ciconiae]|uniref:ATP synthase subunit b n=1 Tax=Mycoplasmopsis ciconiae TaxID=561067 RepID=A0ABU7MKP3_9BACT|nr:ATP synthase F0 subunit B [Mycoplasmopsis ciconiae]